MCNIDCDYCYMFHGGDLSYQRVPTFLDAGVAASVLHRIEEYLLADAGRRFHITLHGGEPTMWPLRNFEIFFARLASLACRDRISVSIQTNCFKSPSQRLSRLLATAGVTLGVSLDGPPEWNDLHRRRHNGKGTYEKVLSSVAELLSGPLADNVTGFLCVANPDIPPP
ncbi:radical SAM protein, partial [Streptococcus pyogenes]|uniref:radical SAM protein n=1 Tax=Streptococcus pyogenes TaxID=1314 RepID=UPI003DA14ECD